MNWLLKWDYGWHEQFHIATFQYGGWERLLRKKINP